MKPKRLYSISKEVISLPKLVADQTLTLATSGFGVAAALAWNEAIKAMIDGYIQPLLGFDSSLISKVMYALLITIIAVAVTMQLTKMKQKLEAKEQRKEESQDAGE